MDLWLRPCKSHTATISRQLDKILASGQETLLSYFRIHNENFDKRIDVNRKKGFEKGYSKSR